MRASSRTLGEWYPRLATAVEAGLSLERSLATMSGPSEQGRSALSARLLAGETLEDALEHGGVWLPAVDRQLIVAGAAAGRLPETLRRLAARHQAAMKAQIGLVLAAAYPLAVAHFGVLAFPIQHLVGEGGIAAYLAEVVRILVPFWALVGIGIWAVRRRWRPALVLLDRLPFVGGFRRAHALADLAFVLEAHVTAGTRIDVAWLQAGIAAGDRRLEPVAMAAAEAVQRGEPVGPAIAGRREVPTVFAEFYRNGELTGRLDESLQFIQRSLNDTAATRLRIAGILYPALIFVAVAVWVAARIVMFYAGYFDQINRMLE